MSSKMVYCQICGGVGWEDTESPACCWSCGGVGCWVEVSDPLNDPNQRKPAQETTPHTCGVCFGLGGCAYCEAWSHSS